MSRVSHGSHESWVMGHSRESQVMRIVGHVAHGLRGSWVTWVMGHVGHVGDGSRDAQPMWVMGHVPHNKL